MALHIDLLMKCTSIQALKAQLKSLPRDFNKTYGRILSESSDPVNLKKFLEWLAFSSIMIRQKRLLKSPSLTLEEMTLGFLFLTLSDDIGIPVTS